MSDLYQTVTDKIVAALEAGTAPWIRPWSTGDSGLPVNGSTQRPYQGINVVLLTLEGMLRGFERNSWLTYRQALALGAQVRGGEHGATVVLYKMREFPDKTDPTDERKCVVPLMRAFTVFNVEQIDNVPPSLTQPAPPPTWDPLEAAERLLKTSGAKIVFGGSRAFYHPPLDRVHIPLRTSFPNGECFYSTALHELSHWSGHVSRLNRDLTGRFKEHAYGAEEIIAEMSSAFICAHLGIEGRLQHASYISSWLRLLRSDKRAVFTAAAKAQQAATYILETAGVMPGAPVEAVAA